MYRYMFVLVATAIVADKSFILVIFQCCWGEVRNIVRCIYREAGTSLAGKKQDNGVNLSVLGHVMERELFVSPTVS